VRTGQYDRIDGLCKGLKVCFLVHISQSAGSAGLIDLDLILLHHTWYPRATIYQLFAHVQRRACCQGCIQTST
jgi:hypothetical protein